jgi:hypothetical protein
MTMKSAAAADDALSGESELNSDKMLEEKLEQALEPLVEPSKRHAVVQSVEMIVSEELYAGPLPHPEHFRRYQEVEPSAPHPDDGGKRTGISAKKRVAEP